MLFLGGDTLLFSEGWEDVDTGIKILSFLLSSQISTTGLLIPIDRPLSKNINTIIYQTNTFLDMTRELNSNFNSEITISDFLSRNGLIGTLNIHNELSSNDINLYAVIRYLNKNISSNIISNNIIPSIKRDLTVELSQEFNLNTIKLYTTLVRQFVHVLSELETNQIKVDILRQFKKLLSQPINFSTIEMKVYVSWLFKSIATIETSYIVPSIKRDLTVNVSDEMTINDLKLYTVLLKFILNVNCLLETEGSVSIKRDLNSILNSEFFTNDIQSQINRELTNNNSSEIEFNDIKLYTTLYKFLCSLDQVFYLDNSMLRVNRDLLFALSQEIDFSTILFKIFPSFRFQPKSDIVITDVPLIINREINPQIETNVSLSDLKLYTVLYGLMLQASESITTTQPILQIYRQLFIKSIVELLISDPNIQINRPLGFDVKESFDLTDIMIYKAAITYFNVITEFDLSDIKVEILRELTLHGNQEINLSDIKISIDKLLNCLFMTEFNITDPNVIITREIQPFLLTNTILPNDISLLITRELSMKPNEEITLSSIKLFLERIFSFLSSQNFDIHFSLSILRELSKSIDTNFTIGNVKLYIEIILKLLAKSNIVFSDVMVIKRANLLHKCKTNLTLNDFIIQILRELASGVSSEFSLNDIKLFLFAITEFNRLSMKVITDKYNVKDFSDKKRISSVEDLSEKTNIKIIT